MLRLIFNYFSRNAMDYTCYICAEDMQWPTLFHCGDHLACLGCVWSWVQQSYTCDMTSMMGRLRAHEIYELKDLYYLPRLGKVKCPSCNRTARCDEDLSQMRVSPTDIAKNFPGFGEWECPFCKLAKATKEHVMDCKERTYTCPNPPCKMRVKLSETVNHNTFECKCYRCPRVGCPHVDLMTIPQFLAHQEQQHTHDIAQQQEQDEEEKDETYEEVSSEDDDYYYESDASSSSSASDR